MLLAYLRGLLHPYYDQGLQSHIRERMILEALSMELDAQQLERVITLQNAMTAPHLDPKKLGTYWDSCQSTLETIRNRYEGNPVMSAFHNFESLTRRANKVFQQLKENGTISTFLEQSSRLIAKVTANYEL